MSRASRLTAREVESILTRAGFQLISQKGSHRKWRHASKNLQVIVPFHAGRTLPLDTMRNILTSAEIPDSEWQSLTPRHL